MSVIDIVIVVFTLATFLGVELIGREAELALVTESGAGFGDAAAKILDHLHRGTGVVGVDRGTGEEHLVAAQRAWITLRDEHCTVMAFHMRGGSAEPMLYNGCRAAMTRAA